MVKDKVNTIMAKTSKREGMLGGLDDEYIPNEGSRYVEDHVNYGNVYTYDDGLCPLGKCPGAMSAFRKHAETRTASFSVASEKGAPETRIYL